MTFSEDEEIPPIIKKILKKLSEEGQLRADDFRVMILNIRINREEFDEIEEYLLKNDLIKRYPKLDVRPDGGTQDIIVPTRDFT